MKKENAEFHAETRSSRRESNPPTSAFSAPPREKKAGWETKTIGDVCDVLDHKRKPITKRDREPGEYPYYGATGVLDHVAGYLFDEPLVLVGEDGAKWASGENTAFAVEGKIWVNNHAHVLRPHRTVVLDNWLIYHLNHSDLIEFVSGLTVPKLNQGCLREIPIPVPPLAEQQRIVGLLDEAFEGLATAKANAEKNLQNARALFESHLQSVFTQRGEGWVEKRLADVADFKNGLNFTRQSNGQTLRMVGVGDFQERSVVPIETLQSVTIDGKLSDDYLIRRDDILTVRSNGSKDLVGRCMLVPDVDGMTSFSGFIIRIRFDTRALSPRFLLHYMKSSATRDRLTRDGGGANISNINQAKLSELLVSLPSFKQQEEIADCLDALREESQRLARLYSRKLAALEALKKSLLHQAFSGAL
jgi:type I restriction enzyme S subunit